MTLPMPLDTPATQLLDNIVWHSLIGPQAQFASGIGNTRRFAKGFSPLLAFADPDRPDFSAIAPFCDAGEQFYSDGWSGLAPAGWQIEFESTMFKMVWHGAAHVRDEAPDAVALGTSHAAQAVELARLTKPGPFDLRTLELGEYFGYFEGGRLIAMAGERLQAGSLREISGVCTHPDARGRGLARRLMTKLLHRQLRRGQLPFLHVVRENQTARAIYQRMGFREYRESAVRIVARRDHGQASSIHAGA